MGKHATQTKVDEFGRVVIPKTTRNRFALRAGSVLEIAEGEEGILLRPALENAPLKVEGGVLVFTGSATGELEGAVRRQREERTAALTSKTRR